MAGSTSPTRAVFPLHACIVLSLDHAPRFRESGWKNDRNWCGTGVIDRHTLLAALRHCSAIPFQSVELLILGPVPHRDFTEMTALARKTLPHLQLHIDLPNDMDFIHSVAAPFDAVKLLLPAVQEKWLDVGTLLSPEERRTLQLLASTTDVEVWMERLVGDAGLRRVLHMRNLFDIPEVDFTLTDFALPSRPFGAAFVRAEAAAAALEERHVRPVLLFNWAGKMRFGCDPLAAETDRALDYRSLSTADLLAYASQEMTSGITHRPVAPTRSASI